MLDSRAAHDLESSMLDLSEKTIDSSALPPHVTRGVILSQWTYWCSLAIAVLSVRYIPHGSIQTAVMLVPVLAAIMSTAVAYWIYESCDEFIRSQLLKAVAVTALIVAAGTLGYFFLELTGSPRVSMLWINLVGWSAFNLQVILVIRRSQ
jgi:hypothetical protein